MKLTIDTNKKQIVIEDSISISELNAFVNRNNYNDYTIVSKDFIEEWKPSDQPFYRQVYCGTQTTNANNSLITYGNGLDKISDTWTNEGGGTIPLGYTASNTTMTFGNFSKKDSTL